MARGLWLLLIVYGGLLFCRAATNEPYLDEAYYSLPGWNLTVNGSFGTPVVDTSASSIPMRNLSLLGLHEHTYWLMPITPLAEAGWISIVGFSLLKLRMLAMIAGFVLLGAWFEIIVRVTAGNRIASWLAVIVIAVDETFIRAATLARPDIFAAMFGYASMAVYLMLREKSMHWALLLSNTLLALAAFTHPNAALLCGPMLLTLVLWFDRKALTLPLIALSVVPYLCLGGAYAYYVEQDPAAFRHQLLSNGGDRVRGILGLLQAFKDEPLRYFGVIAESRLAFLRVLRLIVYFAAFFFAAFTFKRRGEACRILLIISMVAVCCLALFENLRWMPYMIYTVPGLAALTVVTYFDLKESIPQWAAVSVLTILAFLSVGETARLALRDRRENLYGNTVAFINHNARPQALVMGSAEFYFALGTKRLIDDIWLGFYTHLRPDVIVLGPPEDGRIVAGLPHLKPEIDSYMNTLLGQQFHLAYGNRLYKVYLPVNAVKRNADTTTYHGSSDTNLSFSGVKEGESKITVQ